MKYIFVLLATMVFTSSCSNNTNKTVTSTVSKTVSVLADVTDPHVLMPKANPLLQLYEFETNPDAECMFRLRAIADRLLTPVSSCRLADGKETERQNSEDDPQFRKKNIAAFMKRVRQLINDFVEQTDTSITLMNSECIRTISDELRHLTTVTSTEKYLIVFSDLNEKSDLYNVYAEKSGMSGDIEQLLNKKDILPERLDGITVVFAYAPKDRKQDIQYRDIVSVYEKAITKRGGKVFIQASNELFDL